MIYMYLTIAIMNLTTGTYKDMGKYESMYECAKQAALFRELTLNELTRQNVLKHTAETQASLDLFEQGYQVRCHEVSTVLVEE